MKKTIILSVIILVNAPLFSQEKIENFQLKNGELIWQKVISTESNFESLKVNIENLMLFDTILIRENQIVGMVKDFYIDTRVKNSESVVSIPSYVKDSFVNFHCTIDYKPNKYRVTIKRIYYERNVVDSCTIYQIKDRLESLALISKRTMATSRFKLIAAKGFDVAFTQAFSFSEEELW